jgi:hypothetical protein
MFSFYSLRIDEFLVNMVNLHVLNNVYNSENLKWVQLTLRNQLYFRYWSAIESCMMLQWCQFLVPWANHSKSLDSFVSGP